MFFLLTNVEYAKVSSGILSIVHIFSKSVGNALQLYLKAMSPVRYRLLFLSSIIGQECRKIDR